LSSLVAREQRVAWLAACKFPRRAWLPRNVNKTRFWRAWLVGDARGRVLVTNICTFIYFVQSSKT
jgi:hypothetical protein